MNVIFLDIDGVLNNLNTKRSEYPSDIDGDNLERFVDIIQTTAAKVIISSSWRHNPAALAILQTEFDGAGIGDCIIGQTRDNHFHRIPRHKDIAEWLSRNTVGIYAILDDDALADDSSGNFFHTSQMFGLTDEIAVRVIKHFVS
jgi:hypothetical protein